MLSWKIKLLKSEKSVGTWFAHSKNAWTDCDLNKNTGALTTRTRSVRGGQKKKICKTTGIPKALEAACQNANLSRTNSAIHKLRINPDRFWLVTNQYFQSTVCFTSRSFDTVRQLNHWLWSYYIRHLALALFSDACPENAELGASGMTPSIFFFEGREISNFSKVSNAKPCSILKLSCALTYSSSCIRWPLSW